MRKQQMLVEANQENGCDCIMIIDELQIFNVLINFF